MGLVERRERSRRPCRFNVRRGAAAAGAAPQARGLQAYVSKLTPQTRFSRVLTWPTGSRLTPWLFAWRRLASLGRWTAPLPPRSRPRMLHSRQCAPAGCGRRRLKREVVKLSFPLYTGPTRLIDVGAWRGGSEAAVSLVLARMPSSHRLAPAASRAYHRLQSVCSKRRRGMPDTSKKETTEKRWQVWREWGRRSQQREKENRGAVGAPS